MRSRLIILGLAVVVVIAAIVASSGGGGGSGSAGSGGSGGTAPKGALKISLVYSPEKEKLLVPLIQKFNDRKTQVDGKQVFVEGKVVSSGDAQKQIVKGDLKPTVWSPSSSFWGRLVNLQSDAGYIANDNPSIVRTPLVIAMWKPMAQALGWPKKQIDFKQIIKLATARNGWASVGAQFGAFKYVHTNPDFSTSGAEAVAGSYYAFAGKREGLTGADVARAAPSVKKVESAIVHYGDNTLFIEDQLKQHGQGYASAVAMEEATLLDFNRTQPSSAPKLVALYPAEGTFVSDDPYMILNGPWVSSGQRKGAEEFQKFLADEITPSLAGQFGFRPGDPKKKGSGLVSTSNGADPSQPKIELKVPEPKVLNRVLTTWRRDRKPANVLLVLDNSGSMGDENKLEQAKSGLRGFFANAAPQDRIGLMVFSTRPRLAVPLAPFGSNKGRLRSAIDQITPDADTALFQATAAGLDVVKRRADTSRINAVVLLTDGQDTAGGISEGQVLSRLQQEGRAETGAVRLYTIAYGADADKGLLDRFASATGGKPFVGDTSNIDSVYLSISSFF
ncbi:MAG: Ca-activated chloride channel, partial [Thermoleophilaceae bacterium]|nr:Ca-activated chloride channel [Thermoleophilaceae bacterium]